VSYDGAIDIEREEALTILRAAPIRVEEYTRGAPWYTRPVKLTRAEILHDGVWRSLCRTDDCDDVCTTTCQHLTERQYREQAVRGCRYGARIGPSRFAVIDSCTDG
jgi:hypothetical protein